MTITAYETLTAQSPEQLQELMTERLADGWQPFGSPMVSPVPPQGYRRFVQAIVKGSVGGSGGENGGVSVETLEGATDIGKSLMKASDEAEARTAIGAGTSSLKVGATAIDAKAGDYEPAAENIVGATQIGIDILTATDAAAVKALLGLA